MHDSGTGKVMESQLGQPAAAPNPMAGDGIDDGADNQAMEALGREFCALGHGAGNDGGGGCTENRLEDQKGGSPHGQALGRDIVALNEKVRDSYDLADAGSKH